MIVLYLILSWVAPVWSATVVVSPLGVDGNGYHREVTAMRASKGEILLAWATSPRVCAFAVSSDSGKTWRTPLLHRAEGYREGINPMVAESPDGTLYALCMSVTGPGGVFELAWSKDRGKSWSDWRPIVESRVNTPDKPWITITHDGVIHVGYVLYVEEFVGLRPSNWFKKVWLKSPARETVA